MTKERAIEIAEKIIRRLENASVDELFCCEADREEAIEIIVEELTLS